MTNEASFGVRLARWLAVATVVLFSVEPARADESGLRWVGDARVAASSDGTLLVGPGLRFRYGRRLTARRTEDGFADRFAGSFFGGEVSASLLVGATDAERRGAAVMLGVRPWLSRDQPDWFLGTERWSVLGALLPEVGVAFGIRRVSRLHLGWDLPLGPRSFQVVPGLIWLSPGQRLPLLFTLAFRVPM